MAEANAYENYLAERDGFRADMARYCQEMRAEARAMRTERQPAFGAVQPQSFDLIEQRLFRWLIVATGMGILVGVLVAALIEALA